MKKTFIYILMAATALTTTTLASCGDDEDETTEKKSTSSVLDENNDIIGTSTADVYLPLMTTFNDSIKVSATFVADGQQTVIDDVRAQCNSVAHNSSDFLSVQLASVEAVFPGRYTVYHLGTFTTTKSLIMTLNYSVREGITDDGASHDTVRGFVVNAKAGTASYSIGITNPSRNYKGGLEQFCSSINAIYGKEHNLRHISLQ